MKNSNLTAWENPRRLPVMVYMDRRLFLKRGLVLGGAAAFGPSALSQSTHTREGLPQWMQEPGQPFSNYGQPSSHEKHAIRWISANPHAGGNGVSWTPLHNLAGIITPNPLHFERHHNGVPAMDLARWELTVDRNGQGLPEGFGTPAQGEPIYRRQCEKCHGQEGRGATAEELVGGIGSLSSETPARTLGSYWPYAPTIFDYIRRAMPIDAPFSLTDHEVYALTAYLLYLNKIIPEDFTLDAESLARVRMPNRDGFIRVYGTSKPH